MDKKAIIISALVGFWTVWRLGFTNENQIDFASLSDDIANEDHRKFLSLLHSPQAKTIEGFLNHIHETAPEFLSSFTLMYASDSVQKASFQTPRVISYTPAAKLVFTFNDSRQEGGDKIEMFVFNDKTEEFDFYDISFQAGSPQVSEKNPTSCKGCHGDPPRPNWQSYPRWPGAYGSDDDEVVSSSKENREMEAFKLSYKSHPRYKHLFNLESLYAARNGPSLRTVGQSNAHLSEALGQLNIRRIVHQLKKHPSWPYFKYQLLASALGCARVEDLLLPQQTSFSMLAPETEITDILLDEEIEHLRTSQPGLFTREDLTLLLRLRHFAEPIGIDVANWSMSFTHPYRFVMPSNFKALLAVNLLEQDKDLSAILPPGYFWRWDTDSTYGRNAFLKLYLRSDEPRSSDKYTAGGVFCRTHWQTVKDAVQKVEYHSQSIYPPVVVNRCTICHRNYDETIQAPMVSFEDPIRLTEQLKKDPNLKNEIIKRISTDRYHPSRMPPTGAHLTTSQRHQLIDYINSLKRESSK